MTVTDERPICHHCHGTGHEPEPRKPTVPDVTDAEQHALLEQLQEAGERREQHRHARRLEGRMELAKAYEDIRVHAAEAQRIGITRVQVAKAVGTSRQSLHDILTGKTVA